MQVESSSWTNKYWSFKGLEAWRWPVSTKEGRILALPDLHTRLASSVPTQAGKAEEA